MPTRSRKIADDPAEGGSDRDRKSRQFTPEEIRRWSEENAEFIRSWNEYIRKNGLPLRKYRRF